MSSEERENLDRAELLGVLQQEGRRQSGCTLFLHDAIANRLGLNTTDHKCLDVLIHAGTMTPGELSRQTGLTTGAVTGVIDRLEREGLVRREHDVEDRRRILIRPLEPACEEKLGPLFAMLSHSFVDLCAGYSDDELRLLIDFHRRSTELIQEATASLRAEPGALIAPPVLPVSTPQ